MSYSSIKFIDELQESNSTGSRPAGWRDTAKHHEPFSRCGE